VEKLIDWFKKNFVEKEDDKFYLGHTRKELNEWSEGFRNEHGQIECCGKVFKDGLSLQWHCRQYHNNEDSCRI